MTTAPHQPESATVVALPRAQPAPDLAVAVLGPGRIDSPLGELTLVAVGPGVPDPSGPSPEPPAWVAPPALFVPHAARDAAAAAPAPSPSIPRRERVRMVSPIVTSSVVIH